MRLSVMIQIVLNNPDSVTREEFLMFQSAIGYSRAVSLLEEGKRRKHLQKMGLTDTLAKNPMTKSTEQRLKTSKPKTMKKADSVSVDSEKDEQPIQLKKEDGKDRVSQEGPSRYAG